jgi:hypothetical protein
MASSPTSSIFGSIHSSGPFADPTSNPTLIAAALIQHVNIHVHVPIVIDFIENNFSMWSAFFDGTIHKFRIVGHVNGSIDTHAIWHDTEWL